MYFASEASIFLPYFNCCEKDDVDDEEAKDIEFGRGGDSDRGLVIRAYCGQPGFFDEPGGV